MRMIKVTTAGEITAIQILGKWDEMSREIKSHGIERVRIQPGFKQYKGYVMVIDDEGLLAEKPVCNPLGSLLYGTPDHGQPIMGDILIVGEGLTNDGPDFKDHSEQRFAVAYHAAKEMMELAKIIGLAGELNEKYDGKTVKDYPTRLFTQAEDGSWTEEKV